MLQRDQFFVQEFQDLFLKSKKSSPYTKYDLFEFLNDSVNHLFDEEVAEELFERMTKNVRNEFTFNEFIRVYFEAEKLLIQKIEETSNQMMTLNQERDEIQKKYDYSFRTEKQNPNGISDENFVKVSFEKILNKGANNSLLQGKQIYISISFNDSEEDAKTSLFLIESYENIINQSILLKNIENSLFIYVYLKSDDSHLGTYQIGKILLNLDDYEDQLIHKEHKFFNNKKSQLLDISLEYSIVWCFSKLKYYADGLSKWNDKMIYEEEKLNFLRKKLNVIYEPLRVFDSKRKISQMQPTRPINKKNEIIVPTLLIVTPLQKITKILLVIYLILSCLTCFMRAEFFDIGMSLILLNYLQTQTFDKNRIKISLLILLYMIILDVCWLLIFRYDSWVNINGDQNTNPEYSLKYFSLILSYAILIYKV